MELLTYRQGTVEDLDAIENLVRDAIREMKRQGIEQWDEIYPNRNDFEQDIKSNQLFVGLLGEEIAVTYTLNNEYDVEYQNGKWSEPQKPFCVLHRLCVNAKFQNKGIAKKTMGQIEKTFARKEVQAIRLDVFSLNPSALKLYDNFGYTKVGEAVWRKGKFYLMEKYL